MTETKNEAFHRLAGQRIERVEEAIRILSNLSGPSYEWTPAEVQAYLDRIGAAQVAALARFQENKHWVLAAAGPVPEPEPPPIEPTAIPDMAAGSTPSPRELQMLAIWAEPRSDEGALLEMLAMQREVINILQADLDRARGRS